MKNTQNDAEITNQRLGKTIKLLREHLGITQEQLSERAKIDKSELCDLENGTFKCIPIETLISVCPYLNVSLDYLLAVCINKDCCISDRERFYDFEGKEIDLYKIAKNLYSVDAEFLLLLASANLLNNKELIAELKRIILSCSKN